jgi:hypothetical protein
MPTRNQLDTLMAQVEEMWKHQDTLFKNIDEAGQWDNKHGQDWTYADVTYHLAYCNRDLVLRPMMLGRELPFEERGFFASVADINEWNDRKFAERPEDRSAEQSLSELRDTWDQIRQLVSGWTDADLELPYWMSFGGGNWLTVGDGLQWMVRHDWSEFMQLRIHMGLSEPVPSPEITTQYLTTFISGLFPFFLNEEVAQGRDFTTVMTFTDPGVSDLVVEVSGGAASVRLGRVGEPDLEIIQSAETFEKTIRGIQTMPEAIQEGAVRINDMASLETFGELFPIDLG